MEHPGWGRRTTGRSSWMWFCPRETKLGWTCRLWSCPAPPARERSAFSSSIRNLVSGDLSAVVWWRILGVGHSCSLCSIATIYNFLFTLHSTVGQIGWHKLSKYSNSFMNVTIVKALNGGDWRIARPFTCKDLRFCKPRNHTLLLVYYRNVGQTRN